MAHILSLCDYTGNMTRPWLEAGHTVTLVDIQHPEGASRDPKYGYRLFRMGGPQYGDVRNFQLECSVDAVFMFPPCTQFASSGARWWKEKDLKQPHLLREALEVVEACLRIAHTAVGVDGCWMLENPVGRLPRFWRSPNYRFDPCDFGGYLPDPEQDGYTKRTCLWTGKGFRMPEYRPVPPVKGSMMHNVPDSKQRANRRSATPMGFAQAVFEANKSYLSSPNF